MPLISLTTDISSATGHRNIPSIFLYFSLIMRFSIDIPSRCNGRRAHHYVNSKLILLHSAGRDSVFLLWYRHRRNQFRCLFYALFKCVLIINNVIGRFFHRRDGVSNGSNSSSTICNGHRCSRLTATCKYIQPQAPRPGSQDWTPDHTPDLVYLPQPLSCRQPIL